MAQFVPLSPSENVAPGTRLLLRFRANFLGASAQRKIADFLSEARADRGGIVAGRYQVEGATVDPRLGTLNVLVRVRGTPAHLIILSVAALLGVVAIVATFDSGFKEILTATAGAIEDTGKGLGVGLAFAGALAAAFVLGFLDLR